jgi:lysozyme
MKKLLLLILFTSLSFPQSTSDKGILLIKHYEGFRSIAYRCPANVWTIGHGHTKGVKSGMIINKIQGEIFLKQDLLRFESHIKKNVYRILIQNQFDALVSFTFNVGYRIQGELKQGINSGNTSLVIYKLSLYNKAKVKGIYVILPGLDKRRKSEIELYKNNILILR